jgi:hypothetical protein
VRLRRTRNAASRAWPRGRDSVGGYDASHGWNQVATTGASTGMPRLCLEGTNPLHLRYRPQPGLPSNARIYACWPEKARGHGDATASAATTRATAGR